MGAYELAQLALAALWGVGAALVPVFVNAEVYVVALAVKVDSRPFLALLLVVHVLATTAGKAFVFQLARKGTQRIRMVDTDTENESPPRTAFGRWWRRMRRRYSATRFAARVRDLSVRLISFLDHRYLGGVTVFLSALIGVPPLAVVTVLAGASKQPQWLFLVTMFVGRLIQFFAIAFLLHGLPWF